MNKKVLLLFVTGFAGMAQATPLKIALVGPLSGDQSAFGIAMRQGATIAINSQAALFKQLGYEITLAPFDDQASATVASKLAPQIMAENDIVAVVGAYNSSVSNVLGQQLSTNNLAILSPGSTNDKLTQNGWKNFSRVVAPDSAQGVAAANYMVDSLKVSKVAVISDNTTYGNGLTKIASAALKKKGASVPVYTGVSTPEQIDAVVKNIKTAGVDTVYFGGTYDVGALLLNKLREAKVNAKFMGADGLDTKEFLQATKQNAVDVYYTTVFGLNDKNSSVHHFIENYVATFKTQPDGLAAFSYDATNVVLSSLQQIIDQKKGIPTRPEVSESLRKTDMENCTNNVYCLNLSGPISFNSTGERSQAKIFIMSVNSQIKPEISVVSTVNQ